MVSVRTGIPKTTLYRLVRGQTPWDLAQVEAVAEAIGVDPFQILKGAA